MVECIDRKMRLQTSPMPRFTLLLGTLLISGIACAASAANSPPDDFALMKSRLYQRYLAAPGPVPSVVGTLLDGPARG